MKLLPMRVALIMLACLYCPWSFGLKVIQKDTTARISPQGSPGYPKAPRLHPHYSSRFSNLSSVSSKWAWVCKGISPLKAYQHSHFAGVVQLTFLSSGISFCQIWTWHRSVILCWASQSSWFSLIKFKTDYQYILQLNKNNIYLSPFSRRFPIILHFLIHYLKYQFSGGKEKKNGTTYILLGKLIILYKTRYSFYAKSQRQLWSICVQNGVNNVSWIHTSDVF